MYYKYISGGDLKQLTDDDIKGIIEQIDGVCFLLDEKQLSEEIEKKTRISNLYKLALERGKYILLFKDITLEREKIIKMIENYFKDEKNKPKKILIVEKEGE